MTLERKEPVIRLPNSSLQLFDINTVLDPGWLFASYGNTILRL